MAQNFYHFLSVMLIMACESTKFQPSNILLEQNALVTIAGEEPKQFKKGDSVSSENKALLIESPGYFPLLLLPTTEVGNQVSVKLRPVDENWGGNIYQEKTNRIVHELMKNILQVQNLIVARKSQDALAKLELLEAKYPRITYLHFLKVSCLIALGDVKAARAVLEKALKEFPDDEAGKALYQKLYKEPSH